MPYASLKILYVGHDTAIRDGFAALLEQAGYQVTVKTTAPQPANRQRAPRFDLVVRDDAGPRREPARPRPAARKRRAANGEAAVILLARRPAAAKRKAGAARRDTDAETPIMNLRQLRESVRKTQLDVARQASMSQPQLSRLEGRRDHLLSTLRTYVRAIGGDVEVVARIAGRRVLLRDV